MRSEHFNDKEFRDAIFAYRNRSHFIKQYIEDKKFMARARNDGPITSRISAGAINSRAHQMNKLRLFMWYLACASGPRALWHYDSLRKDRRLLEFMGKPGPYSESSIRRRVSDIREVGLLDYIDRRGLSEQGQPVHLIRALTEEEIKQNMDGRSVQGKLPF
jgi:hypothetical protein